MTRVKLFALDAPTFTIPRSYIQTGAAGMVEVPSPAFLVEHPKGLLLFDTSLDPRAYDEDPVSVYGAALADRVKMRALPGQRPDRQITGLGYRVEDVGRIVVSHMHFDHLGGLPLFPDARVFVGRGEFEAGYAPAPIQAGVYRRTDLDYTMGANLRYIPGCDVDVFDDGSVVILWTPGHTTGELSLLVRLPERNVLLTGDTVHCREHLARRVPYYNDVDAETAVRSLDRILLMQDTLDATVWISHDPDDWDAHRNDLSVG
ncbi:MAG: N-acyl homoserine lactone hydrolase [Mycobacterium sp.]|jgi:N-acyl homoserine lactone hydrolase|nr:N-acyl homoserine lactone hydrolase [Mycobacterium sp.]